MNFEQKYLEARAALADISRIVRSSGYVLGPDAYHRIYAIASRYEREEKNENPRAP